MVGGATAKLTADTDTGTPGDQTTLSFDATDWETARTVTVAGVADADGEDETVALWHGVAGTGNYASAGREPESRRGRAGWRTARPPGWWRHPRR